MSKRSQWCDITKELRKYIIDRDKGCIICGRKKPLTMAHIFMSRAKGGKGCKENIVALCTNCHYYILDNPIGRSAIEKSKEYMDYCKKYLVEKEYIDLTPEFYSNLHYHKSYDIMNLEIKRENKCGDCIYLIKKNVNRSTIPIYYCKLCKKQRPKKGVICSNFKNN